jgi:hypothetical protein
MWSWLARLRRQEGLANERQHERVRRRTPAQEVAGDGHTVVSSQSDRAPVAQLVMQGAEGDSVGNLVWPGGGPPSDMCGVYPDRFAHQLSVITADCAAGLVSN